MRSSPSNKLGLAILLVCLTCPVRGEDSGTTDSIPNDVVATAATPPNIDDKRILELELRHQMNRSLPDTLQQSIVWTGEFERGSAAFGGRLTEESVELDRFVYFGEAVYRPVSFASFRARLNQTVRVADETGTTVAMFTLGLCAPFGRTVSFCVEGGPQRRWLQIEKRAWLPVVYRSAFAETGAVLRLNLKVRWNDRWSSDLMAANFENIDVYYLHSPYFQLSVTRRKILDDADLVVFGRYHVLLGFGILDNWTTGAGLRFPI